MNNVKTIITELPLGGILSACPINNGFIFGSSEKGDIYKSDGNIIITLCLTGESLPVSNVLAVDNKNIIASIGGKLFLIFDNETMSILDSNSSSVGNSMVIADFGEDEFITDIIKSNDSESIIISTTTGRILSCGVEIIRAYLTGERTIYANVRDGFGIESNTSSSNITYALYNKIAEITESKEIIRWKFATSPVSILNEKIKGTFISPIMHVKEDFGFWKELGWQENKPTDTDIVLSIRTSDTTEDLINQDWKYSFKSTIEEYGTIVRELNDINISGQYSQVKVEMITNKKFVTPLVSTVSLKYSTKQSSYFFTTRFSLHKDSNSDNGIMIANISEPQNTEIKFGISDKNSTDWKDYAVIDPDKLFEIKNVENMKVGIKFISYDNGVPEVAEFALMVGSEVVKNLNG